MPKSSTDSLMPSDLMADSWSATPGPSPIMLDSVTSISTSAAEMPCCVMQVSNSWAMPPWSNWRGETLIDTGTSGTPSACQAAIWAQACLSTSSPSGTISPVSSATVMNAGGPIRPRSGWRHLTSASMLRNTPLTASTRGW